MIGERRADPSRRAAPDLFPKVPMRHLPELARRLDLVAPQLRRKQVY